MAGKQVRVNRLLKRYAPEEFKETWQVNVENGSVIFGSAFNNWAVSTKYTPKSSVGFKEVYQYLSSGDQKTLAKKSALHKVLLDAVVHHLPSPKVAQVYRIPQIWKGDINSNVGKAMTTCDSDGPVMMMITKIIVDEHAGEVAFIVIPLACSCSS